jgi:hypothetical protein
MKLLKILVSGSFRTEPANDKNSMAFNGVEIIAPDLGVPLIFKENETKEDYLSVINKRLFPIALRKNKDYNTVNFNGLIKIYVDKEEKFEGELSFANKDIKEMSWEELQEMACYFAFREVPLYQVGQLRTAREKAYEVYMKAIKKRKVVKSALDMKVLKENVRSRCQTLGMDEKETQEEINKMIENIFDMSVDPNNLERSYNYAKLPALIALKVDKSQKQ